MPKTLLQISPTDVLSLAADLRYALDDSARTPDPETGEVELHDRSVNNIELTGTSVTFVFPDGEEGRARDFFVHLNSDPTDPSATGNISITLPQDVIIVAPGGSLPDVPIGNVSILYFSEMLPDVFLFRAETVEAVE